MIITMIAVTGLYGYKYYSFLGKNYDTLLARINTQDSTVQNRVSTVSVLKYALWHNSTDNNSTTTTEDDTTVTASNTETSYSDLRPYCHTNEIYLADDEETANTIINGTK